MDAHAHGRSALRRRVARRRVHDASHQGSRFPGEDSHDSKREGAKDRTTLLPAILMQPLQQQLKRVIALYKQDVRNGRGYVPLPGAPHRKYPNAARSIAWQSCSLQKRCVPAPRQVGHCAGTLPNRPSRRHSSMPRSKRTQTRERPQA